MFWDYRDTYSLHRTFFSWFNQLYNKDPIGEIIGKAHDEGLKKGFRLRFDKSVVRLNSLMVSGFDI